MEPEFRFRLELYGIRIPFAVQTTDDGDHADTIRPSRPRVPKSMRADARRNREAVLEAARGLFAEKGFDAQMDEIARKAKVGVGTVYRHFPTKEDLLDALIAQRFETLAERAHEAVEEAKSGDPWEAFGASSSSTPSSRPATARCRGDGLALRAHESAPPRTRAWSSKPRC